MGCPGSLWTAGFCRAVAEIARLLDEGLTNGGLGIGLLLDYLNAAVDPGELSMIFDVAAAHDAPVFVHVRRGLQETRKASMRSLRRRNVAALRSTSVI